MKALAHLNRAGRTRRVGILSGALACFLLNAIAAVTPGADPNVRWRNISRERLPPDVAALALEYTVVLVKDGQERTVDPAGYQFDVGDRILVRIQPKDDMYIYVFTQGPQGDKDCLLPTSDEKPPLVKKDQVIELPDDGFFRFDDPPGEEKLIVVATAEPSKDLAALSNVVFRKPDALLTAQEKLEKKNLLGQNDQRLQSFNKQKVAGAKRRGILSKDAVAEFNADVKVKHRGTIEEPPHGDETSTFAMAVADKSVGKPELFQEIDLKSISRPAPQK